MKVSKYTFLLEQNKKYWIYNSLSNSMMNVEEDYYRCIENAKKMNKEIDKNCFEEEDYKALVQKKIVTQNDKDDFLILKSILMNYRSENNHINITIAPTMDCNYACHYCFEKCKKSYMDSGTSNTIAKYINKHLKSKSLHITWFGGEPLLALNEMQEIYFQIDRESLRSYSSNIITNGFLLDKDAVRVLEKIAVGRIQITLDGTKEYHNKIHQQLS